MAPIREALFALAAVPAVEPLAVSTLRGEFADNAQWRRRSRAVADDSAPI
jgi:hypothetical protein